MRMSSRRLWGEPRLLHVLAGGRVGHVRWVMGVHLQWRYRSWAGKGEYHSNPRFSSLDHACLGQARWSRLHFFLLRPHF